MRHVPRSSQPLPDDLLEKMQAENDENIAIAERNRAEPDPKQHEDHVFKMYSSALLKPFLNKLFHGKCAYCESLYISTMPVDVEHWRPKSEVVVEPEDGSKSFKVGGYYWLAASWDNLLPSCIDCNRRRYQQEYAPELVGRPEKAQRSLIGKKNYFPLADETRRAKLPREELNEEPLLLHPCNDVELEQAFQYEAAMAGMVIPDSRAVPALQRRAEASIYGYALNRSGLVYARNEFLLDLRERFHLLERLAELWARPPSRVNTELEKQQFRLQIEELMDREMQELRRACHVSRPYSLMAQQVVSQFLARLFADNPDDAAEVATRRTAILDEIRATEARSGSRRID
ncbi:hypothetical protein KDL44_11715 [bacterium]|nr:hypothetical protein [bacterium]